MKTEEAPAPCCSRSEAQAAAGRCLHRCTAMALETLQRLLALQKPAGAAAALTQALPAGCCSWGLLRPALVLAWERSPARTAMLRPGARCAC